MYRVELYPRLYRSSGAEHHPCANAYDTQSSMASDLVQAKNPQSQPHVGDGRRFSSVAGVIVSSPRQTVCSGGKCAMYGGPAPHALLNDLALRY